MACRRILLALDPEGRALHGLPIAMAPARPPGAEVAGAREVLATAGTAVLTRRLRGEGSVASLLAATAQQWGADVVVIGSRRRTPLGGLVFGSVRCEPVRRIATPVMLAPPAGVGARLAAR